MALSSALVARLILGGGVWVRSGSTTQMKSLADDRGSIVALE